ncbi:conserved membrane hypothetical protein [Paraburkholderia unamae]|uniref:hypothetical protein n=1 Tax=Paraburkholderia unamae TaxID=219649 RepID=UPI001CB650F9|nr:hypothetical protein [Paraburkholderia unamae]CAG9255584.1 conserved membrane hypothetical protein [Paraburkholderia unamae]
MKIEASSALTAKRPSTYERAIIIACALTFLAAIAAYAGLISGGHWQDEYYNFYRLRDEGLPFLFYRILAWSPRPLSEALVYLYGIAVIQSGRPLIGWVLGITWIATVLSIVVVPACYAARRNRTIVAVAGLALFALFLANHPTAEMYYWPEASLAYMPALAAICAMFWLCVMTGLESLRARWAAAATLIVAASSVEIAAMFVFLVAGFTLALSICVPRLRIEWRKAVWLTLPLATSTGILVLLAHGRVQNGNEIMGDAAIVHHIKPALLAALREFAKALAVSGWNDRSPLNIALVVVSKFLVFGAFVGLSTQLSPPHARRGASRWLAILAAACLATTLLIIAAAFYQFGALCCERHDTLRQCLVYIAIVSAACAVGLNLHRKPRIMPSLSMLFFALAINVSMSFDALRNDYAQLNVFRSVKVMNWNRGASRGSTMLFEQAVPGQIVGGVIRDDKTYELGNPATGWWIDGIMNFFRKTEITFVTVRRE